MEAVNKTKITVECTVDAPVEKVWEFWTNPEHITNWAYASEDWHSTYADNNLQKGGKFKTTMAAKDGSFSFDFTGVYTNIEENSLIEYLMDDGRTAKIVFTTEGDATRIIETFEAEDQNPVEMQRGGWQAILDNFKKLVEGSY